MSVQLDLILPPIVIGILLLLILSMNRMMMESSSESLLTQNVQQLANTALLVVQEELREVQAVIGSTDSTLTYADVNQDTVRMLRLDRDLALIRTNMTTSLVDTTLIPAKVTNLRFNLFQLDGTGPFMVTVQITSESLARDGVGTGAPRFRAIASRDFYLRNLDL